MMNTPRISVARLSLSDGRAVVQRVLAKARTSGTYGELAEHAFKVTNVTRTCKTNCPCLIYHKLARSSLVVESRMHRWCIHMKNQVHSHLPQGPSKSEVARSWGVSTYFKVKVAYSGKTNNASWDLGKKFQGV